MGFIDEVQTWLGQGGERDPLPAGFDLEARRQAVWAALGELDEYLAIEVKRWSEPGYAEGVTRRIVRRVRSGLGARWSGAKIGVLTDRVLASLVTQSPRVEGLDRVSAALVAALLAERGQLMFEQASDPEAWCRAVGMVDGTGAVTRTGQMFRALVGREALQFALELEIARSTGPTDPLRVSRSVLAALRARGLDFDDRLDDRDWPCSFLAARRLEQMGLATRFVEPPNDRFTVDPDLEALLDEILDPGPNPMRALVQALIEAERGRITTETTGLVTQGGSDLTYATTVVHEIRNLLLPMGNHLDKLWVELERPGPPDTARVKALREGLDRSMGKLNQFAADAARLSRALTSERFSLEEVVSEGAAGSEADRNGRIAVWVELADAVAIEGGRLQWVLLFTNLFRNAAQSRAGAGNVWVTSEWDAVGKLHIYVDDDGPGVPEELRERIFEDGVSTRGGSGFGLAHARNSVRAAGGTLVCEASPRGGARFHLHVPAERRP